MVVVKDPGEPEAPATSPPSHQAPAAPHDEDRHEKSDKDDEGEDHLGGRHRPLYRPPVLRQGSSLSRIIDQHPPPLVGAAALPPHMRALVPTAVPAAAGRLQHHHQHQQPQQHAPPPPPPPPHSQHHRLRSADASNFPRVSSDPSLVHLGGDSSALQPHQPQHAIQHHGGAAPPPHLPSLHHAASSPLAGGGDGGDDGGEEDGEQPQSHGIRRRENSVLVDGPALIQRSMSKRSLLGGSGHGRQGTISRQGSVLGAMGYGHQGRDRRSSIGQSGASIYSGVSSVAGAKKPSIYFRHGHWAAQQQQHQQGIGASGTGSCTAEQHRRRSSASSLDTVRLFSPLVPPPIDGVGFEPLSTYPHPHIHITERPPAAYARQRGPASARFLPERAAGAQQEQQ